MLAYAELVGGGDVAAAITALDQAVTLDPSREDYRILLAQALMRQGEFEKATTLLGPVVAAGGTPQVRADARRLLGDVGNIRAARQAGATAPLVVVSSAALATPPAPVPPGSSTASPIDEASLAEIRREAQRASGLQLRPVGPGEQRVLGRFQAIDCVNGTVLLRVAVEGRVLALQTRQLADVDFISYRSTTPGEVNCGPQKTQAPVFATYRPLVQAGVDGQAVAIEVLPDDFAGPNPPR
jgi:hypothetical protein